MFNNEHGAIYSSMNNEELAYSLFSQGFTWRQTWRITFFRLHTVCQNAVNTMSMSMSIIDLYSAESWSISTALCALSGNDEIGSFSAIVWNCRWWAPGRGVCPVASCRLWDRRQRRPDDRKCWAGNVMSGDVEWLTVLNDVGWECLRWWMNEHDEAEQTIDARAMHCSNWTQ